MAILGRGYLSQHVLESSYSFELLLGRSRPEIIYFIISQKRKHYFNINNNRKSKGNMCTSLNWSFRFAAYFIKTIINDISLILACTVFLYTHQK